MHDNILVLYTCIFIYMVITLLTCIWLYHHAYEYAWRYNVPLVEYRRVYEYTWRYNHFI